MHAIAGRAPTWRRRSPVALPYAQPCHLGVRHEDVHSGLLSTPVQHTEHACVLAEVEERLWLDAKFISPRLLEILKPFPHPIVPVVVSTARRRKHGVNLDLRIAERDERFCIAGVARLYEAAMEFDVLLRHKRSPRPFASSPVAHPTRPRSSDRAARTDSIAFSRSANISSRTTLPSRSSKTCAPC
jgi:hypothetical protein